MPETLIWFAAIWFLCTLGGRRSCHSTWSHRPTRIRGRRPRTVGAPRRRQDARGRPPAPPPETVEDRLRRQFVEGRLSIEEYEDRLWRELRPGRPGEPDRTTR